MKFLFIYFLLYKKILYLQINTNIKNNVNNKEIIKSDTALIPLKDIYPNLYKSKQYDIQKNISKN